MSYETYIAWMRLTHNGRRTRIEMSETERAEYDALKVTEIASMNSDEAEEAKRAYEALTKDKG